MPSRPTTRLNLEQLDARLVPAIGLQANTIVVTVPDGGVNKVNLTPLYSSTGEFKWRVTRYADGQFAEKRDFSLNEVKARKILFRGGTGDDTFLYGLAPSNPQLRVEAHGGDGKDYLVGGPLNDLLYGDDGEDTLTGNAGADQLFGGGDHDVLSGGSGNDVLMGGFGPDDLFGGEDNDTLYGCMSATEARKEGYLFATDTAVDHVNGQGGRDGFANDPWDTFDKKAQDKDYWLP